MPVCPPEVAEAVGQTPAHRIAAVNASVDALSLFKGSLGVPDVHYSFADGQHYTIYK